MQMVPNFPSPPPLPQPPVLEHLALESSGWPAAVIALLGLSCFLILNARGRLVLAIKVLAAALLIAGVVWGAGAWVETPRERIAIQSSALVDAVASADTVALDEMLSPDARLEGGRTGFSANRAGILRRVSGTLGGASKLRSWAVITSQPYVPDKGHAQSMIQVRVETESERIVNFSWWLVDWVQSAQGRWMVTRIEPLAIQGLFNAPGAE